MPVKITNAQFSSKGGDYDGQGYDGLDWNVRQKLLYLKVEFLKSDQPGGSVDILLDGKNGTVMKTIDKSDPVYEIKTIGSDPFENEFALSFNEVRSEVKMTWWQLTKRK